MRVQYQLTLDDIQEATTAHNRRTLASKAGLKGGLLFVVVVSVMVGLNLWAGRDRPPRFTPPMQKSVPGTLLIIAGPCLAIAGFMWLFALGGKLPLSRRDRPRSLGELGLVLLLLAVLAIGLPIAGVALQRRGEGGVIDAGWLLRDVFPGLVPWVLLFIGVFAFLWWQRRVAPRKNPLLQEVTTLTVSERSLTFSDGASTTENRWEVFGRYFETENLFVLYPADELYLPIPKRAFPDPSHVDAFRRMLEVRIGTTRGKGFAVEPHPRSALRVESLEDRDHI